MSGFQKMLPTVAWVREHAEQYVTCESYAARCAAVKWYEQHYDAYATDPYLAPLLRTYPTNVAWDVVDRVPCASNDMKHVSCDGVALVMSAASFLVRYPSVAARTICQESLHENNSGWMSVVAHAVAHEHVVVYIAAGVTVLDPIKVRDLYERIAEKTAVTRISVVIGEGAHVTINESIDRQSDVSSTALSMVHIWVEDSAHVTYYAQPCTSHKTLLAEYNITVKRDAQISFFWSPGDAVTAVARIRLVLFQPGAQAWVRSGLAMVPHTLAVLRVHQEHCAPHTMSNVVVRGVLADNARTLYHGMIAIDKGMSGVEAHQQHAAILLGAQSRADALPMLQVNHHEVRCGHGSAVGVLDEAQLVYLQMRGFTYAQARRFLIEAFFVPVEHPLLMPQVNRVLDMIS